MLSAVREGRLENWHREEFRRLSRPRNYDDGIEPTQLFPLKASVERCNQEKLQKLPGEARLFKAMDSYGYDIYDIPIDPRMGEQLLQRLVVAKEITLKVREPFGCALHKSIWI
ncbi:hypothetical protein ID866_387 [Astraeus odoratus]|nr:hypothetical protein ID866_387 [Astraeus odoratus]